MSFDSRAYDNEHGHPVVVLVFTGTHDVSRLVNLLKSGNCEQVDLADQVLHQVRRHNGGRAALQLLAAHGGPDFLYEEVPPGQRFPSADELRPYRGLWVAVKAGVIIYWTDTFEAVADWLRETGLTADSTFYVPAVDPEADGLVKALEPEVSR